MMQQNVTDIESSSEIFIFKFLLFLLEKITQENQDSN